MKKRFLIFFSYIGTGFRGIQRQSARSTSVIYDIPSVSETIELAFRKRFNLTYVPILYTASRTDAGVHALRTSGHIDLDVQPSWTTDSMTYSLNHYFRKIECPIWIHSLQRVNDKFSSRYWCKHRSYLYRFAVPKVETRISRDLPPIPITEYKRCHFLTNTNFNVDAAREIAQIFPGTKDFSSFTTLRGLIEHDKTNGKIPKDTVRTLHLLEINPGRSLLPSPLDENYEYWNVTCQSKSFLYKQVRKMVAVLVGVGSGVINYEEVKYLFDNPHPNSWNNKVQVLPAHGLYLTDVFYDKEDLIAPYEEPEPELLSEDIKTSPKDVVKLSINEKINLRQKKLQLEERETLKVNIGQG